MAETITLPNGRSFAVVSHKRPVEAVAKRSKYGNKRVTVGGVKIDSKAEAKRYAKLQWLEINGEISELERQPRFELAPAVRLLGEKRQKPAMIYTADFRYRTVPANDVVVEDVKSPSTAKTEAFRMKRHLMKSVHGIDVRIVK